jgi:hypothetical protein|nr:MAG TPA: restriction endonuclease [Caudoviricetes sp.]
METKFCKCCGKELPLNNFSKNAFGYISVCKECNSMNRRIAAEKRQQLKQQAVDAVNARALRLEDFTPRELMQELKRRGYEFEMTYTEVRKISSKTL